MKTIGKLLTAFAFLFITTTAVAQDNRNVQQESIAKKRTVERKELAADRKLLREHRERKIKSARIERKNNKLRIEKRKLTPADKNRRQRRAK